MDKNMFWTVFKADLTFGICSILFSIAVTIGIAIWKKNKLKKKMLEGGIQKANSPHVVVFGGKSSDPAHCPLCGQGWPLPGPEKQEAPSA